jgi:hypothetical protein
MIANYLKEISIELSYDVNFKYTSIESFSAFEKTAIGFADYSSSYTDESFFNPKTEFEMLISYRY